MSWQAYRSVRLWVSIAFLAIAVIHLVGCAAVPVGPTDAAWASRCRTATPHTLPDGCTVANVR